MQQIKIKFFVNLYITYKDTRDIHYCYNSVNRKKLSELLYRKPFSSITTTIKFED